MTSFNGGKSGNYLSDDEFLTEFKNCIREETITKSPWLIILYSYKRRMTIQQLKTAYDIWYIKPKSITQVEIQIISLICKGMINKTEDGLLYLNDDLETRLTITGDENKSLYGED